MQSKNELIQGSPEWLEFRKKHIGASDAGVILGINPWKTPLQLWEEKHDLRQSFKSDRMQRGLDLEEAARTRFEQTTGILVTAKVKIHPDHPWMIASLDGIDLDEKNIVEIKCPGPSDHNEAIKGHIPDKYYPQLQHQMAVTGLDMAYYYSFDGKIGVIIQVFRDENYIIKMIEKELTFWECVKNFTPPDLCEKDFIQKHDLMWNNIAQDYVKAKEGREHFEKKEESLKELLVAMCEGSNCKGGGISISKVTRRGNIDYSQIPELSNVELDKYRKPALNSWRISNV